MNFKFRASTILPKEADRWRYLIYSLVCFGVPLLMATVVITLDRALTKGHIWRPGFGEESCWFTSCSKALSIFLYM